MPQAIRQYLSNNLFNKDYNNSPQRGRKTIAATQGGANARATPVLLDLGYYLLPPWGTVRRDLDRDTNKILHVQAEQRDGSLLSAVVRRLRTG